MTVQMEQLRQEILELVYKKAYQRRRVRLASGRESDFYVDCRQVTLTAEGVFKLARYVLGLIRTGKLPVKAVGGPVMGAVPLAAAVSLLSYRDFLADPQWSFVDTFFVRAEPKGHGTGKQVEGPVGQGTPVLMLDDVLTTGGSVLKAARVLQESGCLISKVLVIVDRQEGGRENLEREGLQVASILTREDLENFKA